MDFVKLTILRTADSSLLLQFLTYIGNTLPCLCMVLFILDTLDKRLFLRVGDGNDLLIPFLNTIQYTYTCVIIYVF